MKVFMFHYVKPFSDYYHYDLNLFEKTIKYLNNNYHIISLKDYDNMINQNIKVSNNCVMLTFDDGTTDHFQYVYPILKKYHCSGLFFVSSCIDTKKMLDIQIIHQLLEFNKIEILLNDLKEQLNNYNIDINVYNVNKTLDSNRIALFKQLLQYKLPLQLRKKLLNYFSKKYNVSLDVEKNYITLEEMRIMKRHNMFFGIHTITHPRLELLSKDLQKFEIYSNMNYLITNKLIEKDLCSIAFPYGSYNSDTIDIMSDLNIKYGFKVDNKKSDIGLEKIVLIDRIDCNLLKEAIDE